MIAGIVALIMLFGFSASNNLKLLDKAVKKHVVEADRSDRARELVARIKESLDAKRRKIDEIRLEIVALDNRYDTKAAEYRAQAARIEKAWLEAQREVLDARFKLRDLLSEEEWNVVFADVEKKS